MVNFADEKEFMQLDFFSTRVIRLGIALDKSCGYSVIRKIDREYYKKRLGVPINGRGMMKRVYKSAQFQ